MISARTRKWIRIGLAGPGAIIVSLVAMGGMTLWLPGGAAGIDNIVAPLVLLPLIWVALFFHACLDGKLSRVAAVAIGLFAIHAGLIVCNVAIRPAKAAEQPR